MKRRPVTIKLADGPCADTYTTVLGYGDECWQRLARKEDVWLRYSKNLFAPGEYVWSGEALTKPELEAKLAASNDTYGTSEGA